MSHPAYAVIGAGISGLLLARRLQAAGATVVVLEKSRGYGGRLATKRVGGAVFDQGAQFFTARDPEFIAQAGAWRAAGLVTDWPGPAQGRLVGQPAMTAVPKALAEGLDIRREHKATTACRLADGTWELLIENQPAMRAGRLLLTSPVPQSLALLAAGGVTLPAPLPGTLSLLTYHPCLALLVVLAGPSAVPSEGVAFSSGPVRWLADNVRKGIAQNVPAAVTVHAAPDFSAAHYGRSEAEIAARLLPVVAPWLGAPVVSATLHRWKFSEPRTTHPERCVWLPEMGLGFAGDAFGGPRVEGAALSGLPWPGCCGPELVRQNKTGPSVEGGAGSLVTKNPGTGFSSNSLRRNGRSRLPVPSAGRARRNRSSGAFPSGRPSTHSGRCARSSNRRPRRVGRTGGPV